MVTHGVLHEPEARALITSLETLKVFADPLRQQILEVIRDEPRTVKQIATLLNRQPTKLYYHVNLLEEHKLIRVTETRVVSGIIEKQYRASARRFDIQRSLLQPVPRGDSERVEAVLDAVFNPIRDEIHRSVETGVIDSHNEAPTHRRLLLRRAYALLTSSQAADFYDRLEALLAEYETTSADVSSSNGDSTGSAYRLLLCFFPTEP